MKVAYLKDRIELHNEAGMVDGWYQYRSGMESQKFHWWCNGTFYDIVTITDGLIAGELMEEAFCVERE